MLRGRFRAVWAVGLAGLLGSCAFVPVVPGENATVIHGVRVSYELRDARDFAFCTPEKIGCAVPLGDLCVVQIDRGYFERAKPRNLARLVAHEVGHCLDLWQLGLTHGGFRDEGRRWGAYYASPSEGFAEAYARAYLARCGADLDSLGWLGARGTCAPPDPREVTPARAELEGW